ncbi:MAG TPA: AAA family ATPase [Clostridiaceae bacterium]
MRVSDDVKSIVLRAYAEARANEDEFVSPEHLLYGAMFHERVSEAITNCGGNIEELKLKLKGYIKEYINKSTDKQPQESVGFQQIIINASKQVLSSGKELIGVEHIISAIFDLEESYANYYLREQGINKRDILLQLSQITESEVEAKGEMQKYYSKFTQNLTMLALEENQYRDPLIGREAILERTIQVLCRRNKNNPIHIGEPGVGKTAITLGLAKLIAEGRVPEKLKNAEIFSLDIASVLAGTKYRGDFEERLKKILEELKDLENPIVYIDEIHNLVGAGALSGGTLDASNLLKPYLLEGRIRFIGSTTFEDYKKHFEKDKGLSRRFQTIEVKEPTLQETIQILQGLKKNYESFHEVIYTKEAIESAVILSDKYMNDRFLPDKAIDIIDEAGAYMAIKVKEGATDAIIIGDMLPFADAPVVDERIIEEIIAKVCNIPRKTVEHKEIDSLKRLEIVLKENIFGQDTAIKEVASCIKLSRAGLKDENKPVGTMLFVGPTGVGKTEIAKTLAKTLGVDIIRFDMSEYGEKHAASKLIGAPPGYVGYEEGGMLIDAIRKKPHSVLLLDEIEKAHQDILNVLLQVMDYATLTDSQGRKADFRNVIIIMTSNAGSKNVGKRMVGFGEREIEEEAIIEEVKRIFSPEFRNRLDRVVVFNHIDSQMAKDIAKKELTTFKEKLTSKKVKMEFTDACLEYLAKKGTSREFGAREIIRIINSELKTLLVDEILFGKLREGGSCSIDIEEDKFLVRF